MRRATIILGLAELISFTGCHSVYYNQTLSERVEEKILDKKTLPSMYQDMNLESYDILTKGSIRKIKLIKDEKYEIEELDEGNTISITGLMNYCIYPGYYGDSKPENRLIIAPDLYGCDTREGNLILTKK